MQLTGSQQWRSRQSLAWLLCCSLLTMETACDTLQKGLRVRGVDRASAGERSYIVADAELVNARCTKGKRYWDNGVAPKPGDDRRARCCTVLRKSFMHPRARYAIWMSRGNEICVAHEECHIATYEKDGFVFIPENHNKCDKFGLDKPGRYVK